MYVCLPVCTYVWFSYTAKLLMCHWKVCNFLREGYLYPAKSYLRKTNTVSKKKSLFWKLKLKLEKKFLLLHRPLRASIDVAARIHIKFKIDNWSILLLVNLLDARIEVLDYKDNFLGRLRPIAAKLNYSHIIRPTTVSAR